VIATLLTGVAVTFLVIAFLAIFRDPPPNGAV
jgi:hypothetical protein